MEPVVGYLIRCQANASIWLNGDLEKLKEEVRQVFKDTLRENF